MSDAQEETYWTVRKRYDVELDECAKAASRVEARMAAEIAELQDCCPHVSIMSWIQDYDSNLRAHCWRRCCRRCFKTLATTYARPEGATG